MTIQNSKIKKIFKISFLPFLFVTFVFCGHARADTPTPIFQESFESLAEIQANGGTASGVTIEPGKTGNGALINSTDTLSFQAQGRINLPKGTIEFWVKPNWDGTISDPYKTFFYLQRGTDTSKNYLWLKKVKTPHGLDVMFKDKNGNMARTYEIGNVPRWKAGKWHKIKLFWDFTLPDGQKFLMEEIDDTYGFYSDNIVSGSSVGDKGISSLLTGEFDDLSSANFFVGSTSTSYQADAVIDELKIYDQVLIPVQPFPRRQFNPADPATVADFRKLFENDGFCSPFENYNNQPGDCQKLDESVQAGKNILFFQKPAFERVYENYLPKGSELGDQFDYQAAQGESEDLFFNVYSRINLNNVKVSNTDFQGPGGATIPKENLDLRVVKNWFQASAYGSTSFDELPAYVPELLLQNDQISLDTGNYSRTNVPSFPDLGHAETKIDQYNSKQFVVIVKVPQDAPGGNYISDITLQADGRPDQHITLKLQVLPFQLKSTGKTFTLWHSFEEGFYGGSATNDLIKKDLKDIINHGFDTLLFYAFQGPVQSFSSRQFVIQSAKEAGFKNVILYVPKADITSAYKDLLVFNGFEPWIYGFDEIGETAADFGMIDHIDKSITIHSLGGKVVTTSTKEAADRLENPNDPIYTNNFPDGTYEPLDWSIYPPYAPNAYFSSLMRGEPKSSRRLEGYYWQSRDENPQTNRYRCGYLLWNTNLDGVSPTFYMDYAGGTDWYNDFSRYFSGDHKAFRPYMLAYPSMEGPVPTFQWEATREGIEDTKYLATWKYYKDEAGKTNPTMASDSEIVVNNILKNYKDTSDSVWPTGYTAENRNSMAQYETDRKTIIAEIKKLQVAAGSIIDADLNADNFVNQLDFNILKADFLKATTNLSNLRSDIDQDGQATIKDIGILMSGWR